MALWFYAMFRMLRMESVLKATINQLIFRELLKDVKCTKTIRDCVADIENPKFFKAMYVLLRAVFPALRALRYCDCNEPQMDKIYYLTYRASEALKKSVDDLNDDELFSEFEAKSQLEELSAEAEEVFGAQDEDASEDG